MTRHPRALLLVGLAAAVILQWVSGRVIDYYVQVFLIAMINVMLAVSLNLINGYTGQFSLGHAGFMAVGAYASGYLTAILPKSVPALAGLGPVAEQLWFLVALLSAGGVAALCGLAVGIPSLRLRGDYLAIVTLGFGEIIRVFIQSNDTLGGQRGLSVPLLSNTFWCVAGAAVTMYVCGCVVKSTYGCAYLCTRDDEIAAEAVGIDTTRAKVNAFVVGAFFAGIAGALFAHALQYTNPQNFDFVKSVEIVVLVILGGMGSTPGAAIAAVALTFALEPLRSLGAYRMVVYALLLIVFMLVRPQGILGRLGDERPRKRAQGTP